MFWISWFTFAEVTFILCGNNCAKCLQEYTIVLIYSDFEEMIKKITFNNIWHVNVFFSKKVII